jgi:hypothetical protein
MRPARPTVLVVGSLNIDYIASVAQLPSTGQTVAASALIRRFGGKGANQAIAAARQGARVRMTKGEPIANVSNLRESIEAASCRPRKR